jgi:hypothetical protein
MPPHEPKIDSKEFAIPGPGLEVRPTQEAPGDSVDLTIRLWNPQRPAAAGSVSWKTESVLVYMILDLVTASQGRVDDSTSAMIAHFDSAGRALVAARRVECAILEFLGCRPAEALAAAILIHPPATVPGGLSAGMAQRALGLAEPGQILLSEEAARHFKDTAGIELRAVPALATGGDGERGLAELVWASPDQIARLKAVLSSAQPSEESPFLGATMMVNASTEKPATSQTAQAAPGATAGWSAPESATERSGSARLAGELRAGRGPSDPDLEDEEQPLLTGPRVIVGGLAIVLVAGLVWAFHPSRVTKIPGPVPDSQVGAPASTAGPSAQPNQPALPPTPSSAPEPLKPVVAKPVPPAKPAAEKRGKEKPPTVGAAPIPEESHPVQSVEGMTAKDIPKLLEMARSDAGSGNYDKARREYRIVLELQPSNAEAREGLRRLDLVDSDR